MHDMMEMYEQKNNTNNVIFIPSLDTFNFSNEQYFQDFNPDFVFIESIATNYISILGIGNQLIKQQNNDQVIQHENLHINRTDEIEIDPNVFKTQPLHSGHISCFTSWRDRETNKQLILSCGYDGKIILCTMNEKSFDYKKQLLVKKNETEQASIKSISNKNGRIVIGSFETLYYFDVSNLSVYKQVYLTKRQTGQLQYIRLITQINPKDLNSDLQIFYTDGNYLKVKFIKPIVDIFNNNYQRVVSVIQKLYDKFKKLPKNISEDETEIFNHEIRKH